MRYSNLVLSVALALAASTACAQMTNDAFGSLVVNGVDGPAPDRVILTPPDLLSLTVSGNPNKPFVLALAPDVRIGEVVVSSSVAIDIGPFANVSVVMNGLAPPSVGFLNLFANTGASGTTTMTFNVPPGAPEGTRFAMQAFIVDFSLPGFVAATAATEIVIGDAVGTLTLHATGTPGGPGVFTITDGDAPVVGPTGSTVQDFGDLALAGFSEFYRREGSTLTVPLPAAIPPGDLLRYRAPTASSPRWVSGRDERPHIRTPQGDLYHARTSGSSSAFMLASGASAAIIAGSDFTAPLPGEAWKRHVLVRDGAMAAVLDGRGVVADRIFLIKLDGTTFAATASAVLEITPTTSIPAIIRAESLSLAAGVVFFVGDTSPTSGVPDTLHRRSLTGSGVTSKVSLPQLITSPLTQVGRIDPHLRESPDGQQLFILVGDTADTMSRAMRLHTITATTQLNNTLTPVPLPRIRPFGRASDGTDGRFAMSPGGTRLAYVLFDPVTDAEELRVMGTSGAVSTLVEVTPDTRFDAEIDTIVDPVFADETTLLFWSGTTDERMDLYAFDVVTTALVNITGTNGHTGAVLPVPGSPPAAIDPEGQVRLGDLLVALRGGEAGAGSAAGQLVRNLIGVSLTSLTVVDITGDELSNGAGPNLDGPAHELELFLDITSGRAWFNAQPVGAAPHELMSFDLTLVQGATTHAASAPAGPGRAPHSALAPNADNTGCLAVRRGVGPLGGDAVVEASDFGSAVEVLTPELGRRVRALRTFAPSSGIDGFWFTGDDGGSPTTHLVGHVSAALGFAVTHPAPAHEFVQLLGVTAP